MSKGEYCKACKGKCKGNHGKENMKHERNESKREEMMEYGKKKRR